MKLIILCKTHVQFIISLSILISIIFLEYHFLTCSTLLPLLQYGPASKFLPAVFHVKLSRVTIPGKQVCFPCCDIIIIVVIIITSPSLLSEQRTSRGIIDALRYHFRPRARTSPEHLSKLLVLPSQSIPRCTVTSLLSASRRLVCIQPFQIEEIRKRQTFSKNFNFKDTKSNLTRALPFLSFKLIFSCKISFLHETILILGQLHFPISFSIHTLVKEHL